MFIKNKWDSNGWWNWDFPHFALLHILFFFFVAFSWHQILQLLRPVFVYIMCTPILLPSPDRMKTFSNFAMNERLSAHTSALHVSTDNVKCDDSMLSHCWPSPRVGFVQLPIIQLINLLLTHEIFNARWQLLWRFLFRNFMRQSQD